MSYEATPLVSIIMPAYNAAKHIAEAIESVRNQTYNSWELVVVDDGSTDSTAEIIKKYCKIDSRIKYLYQINNRQGRARNNGLAHSKGELIAFLDADDLWMPNKLSIQVRAIAHSEIDLIFSDSYIFSNNFNMEKAYSTMGVISGIYSGADSINLFLDKNQIPILTVLIKRNVLVKVNGFNEEKCIQNAEDYHLWLKLLLLGHVLKGLSEPLAAYREHAESVSSEDRFSLRQTIEAKANLRAVSPHYKIAFEDSIDKNIRQSLDNVVLMPTDQFYNIIDRYLFLSNRNKVRRIFILLKYLNLRLLSTRMVYFTFNYL